MDDLRCLLPSLEWERRRRKTFWSLDNVVSELETARRDEEGWGPSVSKAELQYLEVHVDCCDVDKELILCTQTMLLTLGAEIRNCFAWDAPLLYAFTLYDDHFVVAVQDAVMARRRRCTCAVMAILQCRCLPRDIRKLFAQAVWSTRRDEGWDSPRHRQE